MKTVKEWFSCQLLTKSLNLVRPFSFMNQESSDQELESYDSAGVPSISPPVSVDTSTNSSLMNRENGSSPPPQPVPVEDSHLFDDKSLDPLIKVEALQINFLRLIQQIRQSPENIVVAQALDRLQLASLIRAGELDKRPASLTLNKARVIAVAKEAVGQRDMDFSIKILVLGRTGVGKSATINSIFNQTVVLTDAFQPATERIQEVVGTVSGIKITFIDTPGLSPAYSNQRRNRKIMLSVKRHIRRSPPDIVLYFERLDVLNMGYSDFSLLKLVNDVFGSAIWFNTIIVMTHSSSALPEGPDGYPVRYETFVNQSTNLVQHYILQVASDSDLDIPVLLVDNHPLCKTNFEGEKVLPNGQVWKSQFLLLCIVTKVLGDANILLKFQDTFQAKQHRTRSPSLPHLLSSLLKPRSFPASVASDEELQELSEIDGEDDYNRLPPIMILTKRQFERLTKDQKKAYLDELDYRETLYMKKQWKEELRRLRDSSLSNGNDGNEDDASSDMVLYDLPIPESFHSDCPEYRYRCLMTNNRSLVRPVLDSQGWDHDVGYDGISVEASTDMKRNLSASISGQMRRTSRISVSKQNVWPHIKIQIGHPF
ncbi:hypothetical protein QJS10_CPB19g01898 [Acorus calamus]|uniref:AIG1-type G domain-containing protein n=1 Tax=Acorus calamus TaxID=4465 RepID=A0AAV9CJU7_ACOCL|nr:hypothetical protein QJS10_CPB19g01898 [Acorus calamus]